MTTSLNNPPTFSPSDGSAHSFQWLSSLAEATIRLRGWRSMQLMGSWWALMEQHRLKELMFFRGVSEVIWFRSEFTGCLQMRNSLSLRCLVLFAGSLSVLLLFISSLFLGFSWFRASALFFKSVLFESDERFLPQSRLIFVLQQSQYWFIRLQVLFEPLNVLDQPILVLCNSFVLQSVEVPLPLYHRQVLPCLQHLLPEPFGLSLNPLEFALEELPVCVSIREKEDAWQTLCQEFLSWTVPLRLKAPQGPTQAVSQEKVPQEVIHCLRDLGGDFLFEVRFSSGNSEGGSLTYCHLWLLFHAFSLCSFFFTCWHFLSAEPLSFLFTCCHSDCVKSSRHTESCVDMQISSWDLYYKATKFNIVRIWNLKQ